MSKSKANQYSVEEMVEAAQAKSSSGSSGRSETREVIIQEDGTKVVKVRRRKRKSQRAEDLLSSAESERQSYVKTLLITLAVMAICGLLLCGFFFFRVAQYNSPDFITDLEAFLSSRLKSNVDVQGYRLGPTSSQAEKVVITTTGQSLPYVKGELSDLTLEHRPESVILGALTGSEAVAEKGRVVIDYEQERGRGTEPKEMKMEQYPFKYKDLDVKDLSVFIGAENSKARITGVEAKLFKRPAGNFQVFLRGGNLSALKGFPKILETATIENTKETLKINSFKLRGESVGHLEIKGEYSKTASSPQSLSANYHQLRLETLDEVLGHLLEARVNSEDGVLVLSPMGKGYKLEASLKVAEGGVSLKNFQFLETITQKFASFGYPYVSFNNLSKARLLIDNTGYHFKDVEFEKQGDLCLEGEFSVAHDGRVSGQVKIGVPTAKILKYFPETNSDTLESSRGYAWFETELSGTSESPTDNFAQKFEEVVDALQ